MVEKKTESTKSEDSTKVVLPGTGENTPNPAEAAKEHEEAIKSALADVDPEYDPLAHRDPARNSDDRSAADAALRPADDEILASSVQQIAQFDESSGQSVLHALANPPKAALEAEKVDPNARRDEDDPIDDALRNAIDAAAERKVAAKGTTDRDKDEKRASTSSSTKTGSTSRTAAKK